MIFLLVGLATGVIGGLFGIGGGAILVPLLVYLFGFSQHQAQGTSLAVLLPPVGLFATLQYYRAGFVDFRVATAIAIGFLIGGYFGSQIATHLRSVVLERAFGVLLLLVALQMIIGPRGQ